MNIKEYRDLLEDTEGNIPHTKKEEMILRSITNEIEETIREKQAYSSGQIRSILNRACNKWHKVVRFNNKKSRCLVYKFQDISLCFYIRHNMPKYIPYM